MSAQNQASLLIQSANLAAEQAQQANAAEEAAMSQAALAKAAAANQEAVNAEVAAASAAWRDRHIAWVAEQEMQSQQISEAHEQW